MHGDDGKDGTDGTDGREFAAPRDSLPPLPSLPSLPSPSRRRTPFGALRHRNYRLFYSGFVISLIGVWMQRVAQAWLVLELTDSALWVGLVEALGSAPVLVFTLYAGALADRVAKHRMVVATQGSSMAVAVVLAAIVLLGDVALWHVALVATLLGVANAFDIPARQSLLAEMVGREDLMNAIALNSSAFNATRVVGPAIAGVVIAVFGVGVCFLLNGLSYGAVLVALALVRLPAPRPAPAARTWSSIREGLAYVAGEPRIRRLVANIALASMFALPVLVLVPVVARDVLGRGAVEFGWMMSAVGVGALAGALALATYARDIPKGRVLGWASTAFGVSVALFGMSRSLAAALVLLVLVGAAMITTTALTNTLLQTIAPDALRGRVVSVYTLSFVGMAPLGALQAGAVAERFGPTAALVAGGAITALAGLGVLRSNVLRSTR